jgi:hypothetical protein
MQSLENVEKAERGSIQFTPSKHEHSVLLSRILKTSDSLADKDFSFVDWFSDGIGHVNGWVPPRQQTTSHFTNAVDAPSAADDDQKEQPNSDAPESDVTPAADPEATVNSQVSDSHSQSANNTEEHTDSS